MGDGFITNSSLFDTHLLRIDMAIPAFIGDPHIGMALVTEFGFICVATHTGAVQTHRILLLVARLIGSDTITDYGSLPILQKRFMIDPNEGLRFDAFLFILVLGKFRFGNIMDLSAHRIVPDRIGNQPKKDNQS